MYFNNNNDLIKIAADGNSTYGGARVMALRADELQLTNNPFLMEQDQPTDHLFVCPVCGENKYEPILINDGPTVYGGKTPKRQIGYKCCGCSIHFDDPEKFSQNSRAE